MTQPIVAPETAFDNLTAFVAARMAQHRVPGAAVGLYTQGRTFTRGLGVTNVAHPLLVTEETLFQIGSITKTFVGTLVMRLVEQGALDLDTPVRTVLPDFRVQDAAATEQVTIRHLLTHTANWVGDFFIDTGEGDDASARYVARMAELGQLAPLGATFSYNNAGFYLLGHLIQEVTGRSFEDELRTRVIDPLGLEQVILQPLQVMTHRFAAGHFAGEDGLTPARMWHLPRAVQAAGGIITTVADMLRYARFHMGDGTNAGGERVLTPASLAAMQTPQTAVYPDDMGDGESIGLTWFIDDRDGVRRISHGGGTSGQISLLTFWPDRQCALAVVTNGSSGGQVTQAAYRYVARHLLGLAAAVPAPLQADESALAPLVGRYSRPMSDLELTLQDGTLFLQVTPKQGFPTVETPPPPPPPRARVDLCAPDRLVVLDGPMQDALLEVIRDEAGAVRFLRMGRIHVRAD